MLLGSFGEFDLIRRIQRQVRASGAGVLAGIGDDAAVVRLTPGAVALFTTDTFVEGIDFEVDFSTWTQIGWKGMAANLSDIAAMGGEPRYALVTLCLPVSRPVTDVDALYEGLETLAGRFGVTIIGGDLSATAGPTVVSITLIGESEPGCPLLRSGARVGDTLCVTGDLGASDAGLRFLQHARRDPACRSWPERYAATVNKHRTPVPRVVEGRTLARSGRVHAMIDISDGLSTDVLHLGQASGVGIRLDVQRLPILPETRDAAAALHLSPTDLALHSGEEFELVCAVAPDDADALCQMVTAATGTPMTAIGTVTSPEAGNIRVDDRGEHPLVSGGYEHFGDQTKTVTSDK